MVVWLSPQLYSCRYEHDAQSFPVSNDERQVSFIVNDGFHNSTAAIACIRLVDANDSPALTLGEEGAVDVMILYSEGQVEPLLLTPDLAITGGLLLHCNV